jgi:ABC-type sugar transport system ATPase subunit
VAQVTFEHVKKEFGETVALADFSLEIDDGEFLVLLGPSGSGKTTALRILAGLEALTSGHVRIGDRIVDMLSPQERDIAMVFQDYALYPQMSVFKNLAFGLRMQKVPKEEIKRRVAEAAEILELGSLLNRKPAQLSGGQRQRVALGRALVRDPQVFLMDEPMSNLDAKLRAQTRGEITRLQERTGKTTVFVTHDQVEAMTMGDRIAILSEGRLQQVGDPATVYERPENAFVAGFVGSPAMSFADFAVSRSNGSHELAHGELRLHCAATAQLPNEVLVGIRPEHALPWEADRGLLGPMQGRVEYIEALGRETFVGVAVSKDLRFVLQLEGTNTVRIGEDVEFGLEPGKLHVFDRSTGVAIGRL